MLSKISMFCALSQNNQHLFEKNDKCTLYEIVQGTENGIEVMDQTVKILFWSIIG